MRQNSTGHYRLGVISRAIVVYFREFVCPKKAPTRHDPYAELKAFAGTPGNVSSCVTRNV
jgi:hypothetical protein